MKVYIVTLEIEIPHHECLEIIGAFDSLDKAKTFVNNSFENYKKDNFFDYIPKMIEDKAFKDCAQYAYSEEGYYLCYYIQELTVR